MSYAIVLFALCCGFAMDLVWTLGVNAVQQRQRYKAANMSALMYICTVISTILIVEKCFLAVVAYIIGGWLGTYIAVTRRPQ